MILFSDSDRLHRHLTRAIELYARACHADGGVLPSELADLYAAMNGPERTKLEDDADERDVASMSILLTYQEAADRLGVSERTLRRLAARGDLATVSIGRARRIRPADLEAFVEAL